MSENETVKNGTICWRELATTDRAGTEIFYKEMFGWELRPSQNHSVEYTEIYVGGVPQGGMITMDEKWGPEPPPPHWVTYLAVDDVDGVLEKIKENGGTACGEPFDVEGVGRVGMASDPDGAYFALIKEKEPA